MSRARGRHSALFTDVHNPRLRDLVGTDVPSEEAASETGARVRAMATDHTAVRVAHPNRKPLPIITPLGLSRFTY